MVLFIIEYREFFQKFIGPNYKVKKKEITFVYQYTFMRNNIGNFEDLVLYNKNQKK